MHPPGCLRAVSESRMVLFSVGVNLTESRDGSSIEGGFFRKSLAAFPNSTLRASHAAALHFVEMLPSIR